MRTSVIVVLIIVALAALLWLLNAAFPNALSDQQSKVQLLSSLGWLALLIGTAVMRARANPGSALRALAVWLLIGLVLVWIYAYRFEAQAIGNRMLAVLIPSRGISVASTSTSPGAQPSPGGEIRFAINEYGHYQINARVNGVNMIFLVDTGASDVVLSPDDALRVGYSMNTLNFTSRVETANGIAYVAPVTLKNISIGGISVNNLPAKVNGAPMSYSLLGMRFLNSLHGWRVEGQTLILEE